MRFPVGVGQFEIEFRTITNPIYCTARKTEGERVHYSSAKSVSPVCLSYQAKASGAGCPRGVTANILKRVPMSRVSIVTPDTMAGACGKGAARE